MLLRGIDCLPARPVETDANADRHFHRNGNGISPDHPLRDARRPDFHPQPAHRNIDLYPLPNQHDHIHSQPDLHAIHHAFPAPLPDTPAAAIVHPASHGDQYPHEYAGNANANAIEYTYHSTDGHPRTTDQYPRNAYQYP